jgi:hypothetical protein
VLHKRAGQCSGLHLKALPEREGANTACTPLKARPESGGVTAWAEQQGHTRLPENNTSCAPRACKISVSALTAQSLTTKTSWQHGTSKALQALPLHCCRHLPSCRMKITTQHIGTKQPTAIMLAANRAPSARKQTERKDPVSTVAPVVLRNPGPCVGMVCYGLQNWCDAGLQVQGYCCVLSVSGQTHCSAGESAPALLSEPAILLRTKPKSHL